MALILLVNISVASVNAANLNQIPSHPRLFFTNEYLPDLRKKVRNTHLRQWSYMNKYADNHLDCHPTKVRLPFFIVMYSFIFQINKDINNFSEIYSEKAISLMNELLNHPATDNDIQNAQCLRALALGYDWCYDKINKEYRLLILEKMDEYADWLYYRIVTRNWHGQFSNHRFYDIRSIAMAGLSMYPEHQNAVKYIETGETELKNNFIPLLEYFSENGEWHEGLEYTRYMIIPTLELFDIWRSALGEDLYQRYPWLVNLTYFTIYSTLPDNTMIRINDNHSPASDNRERKYMSKLASEYRNTHAQWYVNHVAKNNLGAIQQYYDILWYDPSIPETQPDNLPLCRHSEKTGIIIIRSDWTKDATVATFKCGDFYAGHCHLDQNSFTIYRKGNLAIDSGYYDKWGSNHWGNYYSRTIAHNTVTIFNSDELFEGYANDGGQIYMVKQNGKNNQPKTLNEFLSNEQYNTGNIEIFERNRHYAYVIGDATNAYSRHKLNSFKRHFTFLYSDDAWKYPKVVVFDRVSSTNPDYSKKWLLHTVNKPEMIDSNTIVTIESDGKLFVKVVVPSNPKIDIIGGAGHEFEVNGVNYPPETPAKPPNQPGSWRIEIQPTVPGLDDVFLHVLYPVDVTQDSIPETTGLEIANMVGVKMSYEDSVDLALFSRDGSVVETTIPLDSVCISNDEQHYPIIVLKDSMGISVSFTTHKIIKLKKLPFTAQALSGSGNITMEQYNSERVEYTINGTGEIRCSMDELIPDTSYEIISKNISTEAINREYISADGNGSLNFSVKFDGAHKITVSKMTYRTW